MAFDWQIAEAAVDSRKSFVLWMLGPGGCRSVRDIAVSFGVLAATEESLEALVNAGLVEKQAGDLLRLTPAGRDALVLMTPEENDESERERAAPAAGESAGALELIARGAVRTESDSVAAALLDEAVPEIVRGAIGLLRRKFNWRPMSAPDVEEIVADCVSLLWIRRRNYAGSSIKEFWSWLEWILRGAMEKRLLFDPEPWERSHDLATGSWPAVSVLEQEEHAMLQKRVALLEPDLRRILDLRFGLACDSQGPMRLQELRDVTGLSITEVKVRLHQALRSLRGL